MFVSGLSIAFYYGSIFTLISLAYIPLMMIVIVCFGKVV